LLKSPNTLELVHRLLSFACKWSIVYSSRPTQYNIWGCWLLKSGATESLSSFTLRQLDDLYENEKRDQDVGDREKYIEANITPNGRLVLGYSGGQGR
jgi:hypothetical protein